jgi:O-antigen ligase
MPAQYASDTGLTGFGNRYRLRSRSQFAIRRQTLVGIVLHVMAYLSLFRATGMWYGYPNTQNENALVEPATQQMMLYSLVPLIALYAALSPRQTLASLRRVPIAIMVLALLIAISVLLSQQLMASARGVVAVIVISAPILFYKQHYGSEMTFRLVRRFVAAAVLLNIAYTVALPHLGIMGGSLAGSMRGMFMHKNLFGQFSAIAFVLLLPPLSNLRPLRYSTLFYGGTALLALASAVLSDSSTALVLVIAGAATLAIVTIVRNVPGMAVRGYLYLVAVTLLVFAAYSIGAIIAETVAASVGKDTTFSGRADLWAALIPAIGEHPFFGHGFALFRQTEYLQAYTNHIPWGPRSTHNSYLELALNVGLPAAVLWIGYTISVLGRKAVSLPQGPVLRAVRVREVAVIVMVTLGALTEAGLLFAPLITWVLLLAAIGSPETRSWGQEKGRGV